MALRSPKPDGFEFPTTRPMRSASISSDMLSNSTKSGTTSIVAPHANPSPVYISQNEASGLISSELDRSVIVSTQALTLVNEFLDHVLFSLLSTSHSVSIGPLKAAVPAVLKPRLGKAALRVAEEELKEYMEDEEEQELNSKDGAIEPKTDFDTELVWKLARLRCMVYTRLGDLEEEDEEEWLEKEQLLEQVQSAQKRFRNSIEMGPGAAIFLTSVIEYLGEQALYYAAQHAQKRHDHDSAKGGTQPITLSSEKDELVVEGRDMTHIGRDSPLSRLWRSWRRNTRSIGDSFSRPMSPDGTGFGESPPHSRTNSSIPAFGAIVEEHPTHSEPSTKPLSPSQIALPMSEHDIEEIHGFSVLNRHENDKLPEKDQRRPSSLIVTPGAYPQSTEDDCSYPPQYTERSPLRPNLNRLRSQSLPMTPIQINPLPVELMTSRTGDTETDHSTVRDRIAQDPMEPNSTQSGKSADAPMAELGQHHVASDRPVPLTTGAMGGIVGASHLAQSVAGTKSVSRDQFNKSILDQIRNDVHTTPSTTDVRDFEGVHVPTHFKSRTKPRIESSRHEVSDPEDLALSSADEAQPKPIATSRRKVTPQAAQRESWYDAEEVPVNNNIINSRGDTSSAVTYSTASNHNAVTLAAGLDKPTVRNTSKDIQTISIDSSSDAQPPTSSAWPAVVPGRNSSMGDPLLKHSPSPSKSSQHTHHSKSSSSSSKLLDFTRDVQGRPQTIHQQRAAGDMPDNIRAAHSATPTNVSRDSRPGTADSSSTTRAQHLRIRTDSEELVKQHAMLKDTDEDKKKSLEVLIKSGETLHYTLTPATATVRPSELSTNNKQPQTQDLADFIRSTGPTGQESSGLKMIRSTNDGIPTSPTLASITTPTNLVSAASQNAAGYVEPKPKARSRMGEPRDPKVERMTGTRDLADYARSTGPSDATQMPKALAIPRSPNSNVTDSAIHKPIPGRVVRPANATPSHSFENSPSTARKTSNRFKLQARDPRPSRHAESTDLIDFIREGPPRPTGDHRINRHVAPFRTTMDSDDFNNMTPPTDRDSVGRSSFSSAYDNHRGLGLSASSISQTGSLNQNSANGSVNSNQGILRPSTLIADIDDPTPKRTRTKVRDPYAIDYSDDEFDPASRSSKKQTQDESLIDFLRNTAPPPGMTTQPIMAATGALPQDHYVERMSNNNATSGLVHGAQRSSSVSSYRNDEPLGLDEPRPVSPHLTQSGSRLDSYKPTKVTHAAHIDRQRNKPRRGSQTNGEDLASFLRTTEPPAYTQQPQHVPVNNSSTTRNQQQQDAGPKKFFSFRGRSKG